MSLKPGKPIITAASKLLPVRVNGLPADFVAVDHRINSVGPMLHQLGTRSHQHERSNLIIDRLDAFLIEMREAQLDHIAIPELVAIPVDLLVAESRKGASEAMGAMLGGSIIADQPITLSRLLSVLLESDRGGPRKCNADCGLTHGRL